MFGLLYLKYVSYIDFHGDTVYRNIPANAGDMGSICGPSRSNVPQSN